MLGIKRFLETTPVVRALYWHFFARWRVARERERWATLPADRVFREIYDANRWGDAESRSGTGSNLRETETVRRELAALLPRRAIRSISDVPCGDFCWMSRMDLGSIAYFGGDIVPDLIATNRSKYKQPGIRFEIFNLLADPLPAADLLICRDCLVHLSLRDIFRALQNILASDTRFLLTTTFTSVTENRDIVTGEWRMINLERPPFCLPPPLELIKENCREHETSASKSLALWEIATLRRHASASGWIQT